MFIMRLMVYKMLAMDIPSEPFAINRHSLPILLVASLRCRETFEVMLALIQRGAELLKESEP